MRALCIASLDLLLQLFELCLKPIPGTSFVLELFVALCGAMVKAILKRCLITFQCIYSDFRSIYRAPLEIGLEQHVFVFRTIFKSLFKLCLETNLKLHLSS